jgi:hypothetical protein
MCSLVESCSGFYRLAVPKRRSVSIRLHSAASQKTATIMCVALVTSDVSSLLLIGHLYTFTKTIPSKEPALLAIAGEFQKCLHFIINLSCPKAYQRPDHPTRRPTTEYHKTGIDLKP